MGDEIRAGKFQTHCAPNIFFELNHPDVIQLPWRMFDIGCQQPSTMYRVKAETRGQKHVESRLFGNLRFFRDLDSCFGSAASIAEINILDGTNIHVHVGPEVGKTKRGSRANNSEQFRSIPY